jgi:hypothetical protein
MFQTLVAGNYDTSREFQSRIEYTLFCARWRGLSTVRIQAERVEVILFVCSNAALTRSTKSLSEVMKSRGT